MNYTITCETEIAFVAANWLARNIEDLALSDSQTLALLRKANEQHEHYLTDGGNIKNLFRNQYNANEAIRELVAYVASKPIPR